MTPLDPDPLTILPPDPPTRRGCSVLPFLVILFLASLAPAPSGALNDPAFPPAVHSVSRGAPDGAEALGSARRSAGPEVRVRVPAATEHGEAGTVIVGGWAAFCDPTPSHCQDWAPPAKLGAMPSFDFGDEPFVARVCRAGGPCTLVRVLSYCACGPRHAIPTVIDLSPAAMAELDPDYRRLGILRVTVEWPVELPQTDKGE